MTDQNAADNPVAEGRPATRPARFRGVQTHLPGVTRDAVILACHVIVVFALSMWGGLVIIKLFSLPTPRVNFGEVAFAEVRTDVPPAPIPPVLLPLHSVLFANGSRMISADQRSLLASFAKGLRDCAGMRSVTVIGSVSSAPFRDDPDNTKNTTLARRRAEAVTAYIRQFGVSVVDPEEGRRPRRFDDVRTAAFSPRPAEALNRRADVILIRDDCSPR
jgi:hypothetical protein